MARHRRAPGVIGDNVHLVGSPEKIVDWFGRLGGGRMRRLRGQFFSIICRTSNFSARDASIDGTGEATQPEVPDAEADGE